MLQIALWEPEIPPNTGSIARLCAATGTRLHLVGRLGFRLDDRRLRRAGLDYWADVDLTAHAGWDEFAAAIAPRRLVCATTKVARRYTELRYADGDCLVFGSESRGLPEAVLRHHADAAVTIPMPGGCVRSLNLAAAAAIVLYEALRQVHGW
jgi:tRNA (cytidine/uridine-2'-O-)-methyltransferase